MRVSLSFSVRRGPCAEAAAGLWALVDQTQASAYRRILIASRWLARDQQREPPTEGQG